MLDPVPGQSRGVNDPENARVVEVQRPATEIDLVQDDDLWPFRQTGPVLAELVIDRRETFLPVVRLLARGAHLRDARSLLRRRREAAVAGAPGATVRDGHARARVREVGEQPALRVEDLRPDRHAQLDGLSIAAVSVAALAVAPATRGEDALALEEGEIAQVRVGDELHVAAVA